jgi:hypothetical protein
MVAHEREALKTFLDGIEALLELGLKTVRNYRQQVEL